MSNTQLHIKSFQQLTVDELYELLRVRSEVFVVEQDCVYQDMDGDDKEAIHVWLTQDDKVVALARVCPAGVRYKRYLVHNTQQSGILDNKNVVTRFKPVAAGTEFVVPIYFHNLRDYELGALLAAISFCNKENQCFHSLGFAKPYGYGKMKIQGIKLSADKDVEREELYQAYINKICSECKFANEATMLSSISNLFILASNHSDKEIRYPKLKPNEFVDIKKAKLSINNLSPKK